MKIEQYQIPYMMDILKDFDKDRKTKITIYKPPCSGPTSTIDNPVIFQPEIFRAFKKNVGSIFTKTWEKLQC